MGGWMDGLAQESPGEGCVSKTTFALDQFTVATCEPLSKLRARAVVCQRDAEECEAAHVETDEDVKRIFQVRENRPQRGTVAMAAV